MAHKTSRSYHVWGIFITIIGLLAIIPFYIRSVYLISFLSLLFLNAVLACSWNVLGGYAGLVCLGIGAFFGVGAYCTAIMVTYDLPILICIILSGIAAIMLALLFTPVLKLRGVYFSIGTLFLPDILRVFVLYFGEITGGSKGIYIPMKRNPLISYLASLVLMASIFLIAYKLVNSRYGLAIKSLHDDEEAAEMFGVKIANFKMFCLVLCAVFSGLAGGVYALYIGFLEPYSTFAVSWSVGPVFMAIIGGVGTLVGPLIGSIIYTFLTQWLIYMVGEFHLLILGISIILIIMLLPSGIVGGLKKIFKT